MATKEEKKTKLSSQRDKVRGLFDKVLEHDASSRKAVIKWLILLYKIKCENFAEKADSADENSGWTFKKSLAAQLAPFAEADNQNANKLPSTSLVQWAQASTPKKGRHSRTWKYSAVILFGHNSDWDAEEFEIAINEQGMSGLLKKYKEEAGETTESEDEDEDEEKNEKEVTKTNKSTKSKGSPKFKPLTYYTTFPNKTVYSTKKTIVKSYVGKIVIGRVSDNGFEILEKYPGQK
jgi:hypothetical protein